MGSLNWFDIGEVGDCVDKDFDGEATASSPLLSTWTALITLTWAIPSMF